MNEEQQRLGKGMLAAVAVHLAAAVVLGVFGWHFIARPPQILEVTLDAGGGPQEQQQEQIQEDVAVRSVDDIIDNRLKPEKKKVVYREPKKQASPSNKGSAKSSTAAANAAGSGAGAGQSSGEGRGVPVTPPRLLSAAQPKYPGSARRRGIEGVTAVKMLVGANGRVQEAFVVRSSGSGELDEAALKAVYKWRFSPARDKLGQKAPCYVTQGIRFDLRS